MTQRSADSGAASDADAHIADLRAEARHARERYDLYKAKAYGPRLTSPSRMRELMRASEQAEARLAAARAEQHARPAAPPSTRGGAGD